jgi:hypothetical protein
MFKLTDFTDPQKFLEWLNYDGKPPTTVIGRWNSLVRRGYTTTVRAVTDPETLESWWRSHRQANLEAWQKSKDNPYKPLTTHSQYIAECLRFLGFKTDSVASRLEKAIASRPDIYQPHQPVALAS